jgi:hypothetical protein
MRFGHMECLTMPFGDCSMVESNPKVTLREVGRWRTWIFYSEAPPVARNLLILLRRVLNLALT